MLGPPGAGKSMLARRLTTILPDMTLAEAIETTRIHRVAGLTGNRTAVVMTRPFRAPHHIISDVGLIGGGQVPLPGEVSLAHHGVLFLDELPACRRQCWRCCASRSRKVSHTYNLPHVLNLTALVALATRTQRSPVVPA
jgi:predicted ATPase with chaperone activity